MPSYPFNTLKEFRFGGGIGKFYSLPALEDAGFGKISRMPPSLRIVLESLLRNCDGKRVTEDHVRALANWEPNARREGEVPFVVSRVLLQDMSGLPALNDLAMFRAAAKRLSMDADHIEPLVPVDAVIDHSVEVDFYGSRDALARNMEIEFRRNTERFQFLKWCEQAFSNIRVVPPGNGICHQVNLEFLAKCVWEKDGLYYFDTLVGTDSHTTMINSIGVVGWGCGGLEAECGMLGQPIYFLTPDVVGVHLKGSLRTGVTATDLVLALTEALRKFNVVGKFVEYFGEGAASLSVTDRATISNMAPDYGATLGFFAVDEKTLDYLRSSGRDPAHVEAIEAYCKAQRLFGIPREGDIDYTAVFEFDLGAVVPNVAGPTRPQDRIDLEALGTRFRELFIKPTAEGGYGGQTDTMALRVRAGNYDFDIGHGDIAIAAITSCTNTSNPQLMLGAGILARNAVARGLKVHPRIKTSLAPGSRVVTSYLKDSGLLARLEELGFHTVAYGCTTCGGGSGPLDPDIEAAITQNNLVVASVLSGNRNFEARIHPSVKANFLMSPALVIAFAIAGTVAIDITRDPLGTGRDGQPVYLADIWPSDQDITAMMRFAGNAETYRREYSELAGSTDLWSKVPVSTGAVYKWDPASTFIMEPPFLDDVKPAPAGVGDITGARALCLFGDSITTDHISSVAPITAQSPAGKWLSEHGVLPGSFGNYGVRRLNHQVMVRGTFANVRIRNQMAQGTEGGVTIHQPSGDLLSIFDASVRYRDAGVPLVVFAGKDYGTGSARDWAARGTYLLGVKLVVARSFERIHRSNLIGMGVLPAQFKPGTSWHSLGIDGSETFDLIGISGGIVPMQDATLVIHRKAGTTESVPLLLRVDTSIEADYLRHGGILPFVFRELMAKAA